MNTISHLIEERSRQLAKNRFCLWILEEEGQEKRPAEKLSFIPSMLYFVLGFRDILENLKFVNPRSEIEHIINRHCEEDENHWCWYLEDLKTLGLHKLDTEMTWAGVAERLWSPENKPTRDLVHLCIHLIKKHNSAQASLVIIECLEATFGIFMSTLKRRFEKAEIYKKLYFFGQRHEQQEMDHSLGHWIDSKNSHLESLIFSSDERAELYLTIEELFNQFEIVFETWFNLRNLQSIHLDFSSVNRGFELS